MGIDKLRVGANGGGIYHVIMNSMDIQSVVIAHGPVNTSPRCSGWHNGNLVLILYALKQLRYGSGFMESLWKL